VQRAQLLNKMNRNQNFEVIVSDISVGARKRVSLDIGKPEWYDILVVAPHCNEYCLDFVKGPSSV
jgi:hypothetical protein